MQQPTNCLSEFDHFGGFAHKGLKMIMNYFQKIVIIAKPELKNLVKKLSSSADLLDAYKVYKVLLKVS